MKKIIVVVLLVLSTSCGSLLDRNREIPIDSEVRGERVLLDNKKEIGITPFYYNLNYWDDLYVDGEEADFTCKFNWFDSIALNGLLTVALPPLGLLFYGVDFISGDIYKCNERLVIESKKNGNEVEKKINYLFLPTLSFDHEASEKATQGWFKENLPQETSLMLHDEDLDAFLNRYLIFQGRDNDPTKIKMSRVWRISSQIQAERFVYFRPSEKFGEYQAEIYDTATMQKVVMPGELKNLHIEEDHKNQTRKFVLSSIFSLPNSFTLQLTSDVEPEYTAASGATRRRESYEKDNLLEKLTRLSMLDIDHPELFEIYDYSFKLSPQLAINSWEYQNAGQNFYSKANIFGATYDAITTVHTLIGQIQIALGAGGVLGNTRSDNDNDISSSVLLSGRVSWIVFLNKNLFINTNTGSYSTSKKFLNGVESIKYQSVQIGYYFPELHSLMRSLF
jgi:hypothetical protein